MPSFRRPLRFFLNVHIIFWPFYPLLYEQRSLPQDYQLATVQMHEQSIVMNVVFFFRFQSDLRRNRV